MIISYDPLINSNKNVDGNVVVGKRRKTPTAPEKQTSVSYTRFESPTIFVNI